MISLYSGTPGAGKSLHLASRLLNWMRYKNAPIIGNFPCNFDCIRNPSGSYLYIDNSELTVERLINFSRNYAQYIGRKPKEGEILLVIDECQIMFNSRDWGQKDRAAWCSLHLHSSAAAARPRSCGVVRSACCRELAFRRYSC